MRPLLISVAAVFAAVPAAALELSFEANHGQAAPEIRYLARAPGYSLYLGADHARLHLSGDTVVRISPVDAADRPRLQAVSPQTRRSHYFLGESRNSWRASVGHYGGVEYRNVYPGIDWVFRSGRVRHGELEYDFVVNPGADPASIGIELEGIDGIALAADGSLVIRTRAGELHQSAPVVFQDIGGERTHVPGRYRLGPEGQVGFEIGDYDRARPLVIDPELVFSTYIGGSGDDDGLDDTGLAIDAAQNAYLVGTTDSLDLPGAGNVLAGGTDVFVTKVAADGSSIIYTTYIGGSGDDIGRSVTVDEFGNAFVTGETFSTDFPTVAAAQPGFGGGSSDSFLVRLDSTGSTLLYSTYFGGSGDESGKSIAPDASGGTFMFGDTTSADLPVVNAFQPVFGGGPDDAFAMRLDDSGSGITFATYIGGSGGETARELSIDGNGNVLFAGFTNSSTDFPVVNAFQPVFGGGLNDGFVTGLTPAGTLFYSTFIGGLGIDVVTGVDHDEFGNIYLSGDTNSPNFPTLNAFQTSFAGGIFDTWLAKLRPDGTTLVYATYFGGPDDESVHHLVVDDSGNAYPLGHSNGPGFPLLDPVQSVYGGGTDDIFSARVDPAGNLVFSTFLGGNGADRGNASAVLPGGGDVFFTSDSASTDFPVLDALQSTSGGGLDLTLSRLTEPGPEVTVSLVDTGGTTRFRVTVANGAAETRQVELKVWLDAPELDLLVSLLGIPTPVLTLPASLAPVQIIDFPVPAGLSFPGTRAGARIVRAETGAVISKSVCTTVPCN